MGCEGAHCRLRKSGARERVIYDEQRREQDEQGQLDLVQQLPGGECAADDQAGGNQQCGYLARQRGREQDQKDDEGNSADADLAAIEGELVQRRVDSGCGKARPPHDGYTSEADQKPNEGGDDGVREVGPKADCASLANQNVLGIAYECGSRPCIAGRREPEEERPRIEMACRKATAQERSHSKNDDVVDKECGENPADGNSQREKPQRAACLTRNPGRRRVVEAAGTNPR